MSKEKFAATVMQDIEVLRGKIEQLQEETRKKLQYYMTEFLAEYFYRYPRVNAIQWTQYTPYFNDGDTCEFGVGDPALLYDFTDEEFEKYMAGDLDDYEDRDYEGAAGPTSACRKYNDTYKYWYHELDDQMKEAHREIYELLNFLGDDVLENMYGDHAKIIISRDLVSTVEEYQHD